MAGNGDPEEDLEALDEALGALEENGTDADADALSDAIDVFDSLQGSAEAVDAEDSEAADMLRETEAALNLIAQGEGTEEDVETATEGIALTAQQMQVAVLKALLGSEGGGSPL